jgi:type II restriction enzyme
LDEILTRDTSLSQRIDIIHGSKLSAYKKQLVIRNWSDILPDADFAIINKKCGKVVAVLSCKTSLRERLTETAFWARELKPKGIDVIFITTDKDEEITAEVNRYIVMHVLDYTAVTDPQRYNRIVHEWRRSYGSKPDFNSRISKLLRFIDIIPLLQQYAVKCEGG